MTDKEQYLADMRASVEAAWAKRGNMVSGYPADVEGVITLVAELWNLRVPQHKKQKAYWIDGARQLLDACGEKWDSVLRAVREDFEQYMSTHGGLAPYTIASPLSLVKVARAKEAILGAPPVEQEVPAWAMNERLATERDKRDIT